MKIPRLNEMVLRSRCVCVITLISTDLIHIHQLYIRENYKLLKTLNYYKVFIIIIIIYESRIYRDPFVGSVGK